MSGRPQNKSEWECPACGAFLQFFAVETNRAPEEVECPVCAIRMSKLGEQEI